MCKWLKKYNGDNYGGSGRGGVGDDEDNGYVYEEDYDATRSYHL